MTNLLTLLIAIFISFNLFAESIVDIQDSERILSMSKEAWNENAKNTAKAMPNFVEIISTPDGLQIFKLNDPNMKGASSTTIPFYLGSSKTPISFDLINVFPTNQFPTSDPNIIKDICNQAINELKSKFSAICVYSISDENIRIRFSVSNPNYNYLISNLNNKNIFTMSSIEWVKYEKKYSKEFIKNAWANLNDIFKDKESRIVRLITDAPRACFALVHYHGIKYDSGETYYSKDPEALTWDVDFCLKATAHRLSPQPEFENKEIVKQFCGRRYDLYQELCKASKI